MNAQAPRDWRLDYIVCEHVASQESAGHAREGLRVCCDSCREKGWLHVRRLRVYTTTAGLTVGEIPIPVLTRGRTHRG